MESINLINEKMEIMGVNAPMIAECLNVRPEYIRRILNGGEVTNITILIQMCGILNVPLKRFKVLWLADREINNDVKWDKAIKGLYGES